MKANGPHLPHAPIEACPLQQRHEKAPPTSKTRAPHFRPLRGIGEAAGLVTRAAETQVRLKRSTGKAELALPAQRRQPSKYPESSESPKLLLPLKKKKKKKSRQRRRRHSLLPATPHSPSARCSPGAPASGPATTRGPAPPPLQVSPCPAPLAPVVSSRPGLSGSFGVTSQPPPPGKPVVPTWPRPPGTCSPSALPNCLLQPRPPHLRPFPTSTPPPHTYTCRPPDQNPHPYHATKAPRPGPGAPHTA